MSITLENTRVDKRAQADNNAQGNNKELRKFGFLFAVIVVVLFEDLLPWLKNKPLPSWPLHIAVPIAWTMRGLGRDPLARRFGRAADSYRIASAAQDKAQMEKPY